MFSGTPASDNYIEGIVQDWGAHEYTLGAYSFPSVDTIDNDGNALERNARVTLQKPIADGRILFAGEGTHLTAPATVPGAVMEGERAAMEGEPTEERSLPCVTSNTSVSYFEWMRLIFVCFDRSIDTLKLRQKVPNLNLFLSSSPPLGTDYTPSCNCKGAGESCSGSTRKAGRAGKAGKAGKAEKAGKAGKARRELQFIQDTADVDSRGKNMLQKGKAGKSSRRL